MVDVGIAVRKGKWVAAGGEGDRLPEVVIQIEGAAEQVAAVGGGEGERGTHMKGNSFFKGVWAGDGGHIQKQSPSGESVMFLTKKSH